MDENLIKEILKEYTDGKSSRELAQKYGCSNQTILNRLHEYCDKNNINIDFHKSPLASTRLNIPPEDVYNLYIDGLTPSSIADIYNCSSVTILSRLREYTDKMGIELVLDLHRVKLPDEEIYEKYEFTNNCDSEKTNRKALYKMLVDIEKIDSSIPYNNYYLNYFE